MLMRQQHAIELFRRDAALLEPKHDLARAQPAIDQNPAMIGRDQRAIPGAAAAEHGETEHARYLADAFARFDKWKFSSGRAISLIARYRHRARMRLLLGGVIERAKSADFFEPAHDR